MVTCAKKVPMGVAAVQHIVVVLVPAVVPVAAVHVVVPVVVSSALC